MNEPEDFCGPPRTVETQQVIKGQGGSGSCTSKAVEASIFIERCAQGLNHRVA